MSKTVILLSSPPTAFVRTALDQAADNLPMRIIDSTSATDSDVRVIVNCSGRLRIDAELMQQYPRLELIAHHGVGYDNIDVDWAHRHGIVVTHTPDVLPEEVADLAFGLLLATVRRIAQADQFIRRGDWLSGPFPLTPSLQGRTLGIVGLGRIGRAIARRAEGFGLPVLYYGRHRRPDVSYRYFDDLKAMAEACDILLVAASASSATRHIIDAPILQALGADGILINIARGSLVDEAALAEALRHKTILGAGLDVFEDEPNVPDTLVASDHTVLLPHVGSATFRTRKAMAELVVANVTAWLSGKGALTPVPETTANQN